MGRGNLVWILCLGILVAGFAGAQVNPLAFLMAGVLAPLPVTITPSSMAPTAENAADLPATPPPAIA